MFEVYQNKQPKISFKLEVDSEGHMDVYAVDEDGESINCLVTFRKDGKLQLHTIDSEMLQEVFDLDSDNKFELYDEDEDEDDDCNC